jgi:catechol 2,3-dioxygenase
MQDGRIQMFTERLDFDGLMKAVPETKWGKMPDKTTLGHVHLKVHNIPQSVAFYANVIGFDITSDEYPGAGFVSAGGYHHHLGMNTWHSAGARPLPAGAAGLAAYSIQLPDDAAREKVLENVYRNGVAVEETAEGPLVQDPAGVAFVLDVTNRK